MSYQKPFVMMNDDLAEGVYAASGEASGASSETPVASYSLSLTNSWDGNKQYSITITNNTDETLSTISVNLKVNGNVTGISGNVSGTINGSTATVTFNNYGNGIAPNATYSGLYMAVTGTGDFSLE